MIFERFRIFRIFRIVIFESFRIFRIFRTVIFESFRIFRIFRIDSFRKIKLTASSDTKNFLVLTGFHMQQARYGERRRTMRAIDAKIGTRSCRGRGRPRRSYRACQSAPGSCLRRRRAPCGIGSCPRRGPHQAARTKSPSQGARVLVRASRGPPRRRRC